MLSYEQPVAKNCLWTFGWLRMDASTCIISFLSVTKSEAKNTDRFLSK
jgi:hypothetical protein